MDHRIHVDVSHGDTHPIGFDGKNMDFYTLIMISALLCGRISY